MNNTHSLGKQIHTYNQFSKQESRKFREKKKERTWRPAREEREMGFFLSLSLLPFRFEDFPIIKPFAPFPDIFPRKLGFPQVEAKAESSREREGEDAKDPTKEKS